METDFTWSVIKFTILTVIFITILFLLFTVGNLQEIAANFPRYRCNPIMMPFASNFGYDTKENFEFCLNSIFQTKAAEIFGPIYNLLGGFTQVITLIVNVTLGIRKLFANFLYGVNSFVRNVRDKIQAVLFSIRMSFVKLNNLMGRVYGTMYAVIFMGMSAMTAGFNIADNDLVKFLFEFCFDPNTKIQLYDGTSKLLKDIQIGDRLLDVDGKEVKVTSTFRFSGIQTPMVKIGPTTVSSEHFVEYIGKMIPAKEYPDAYPVSSLPELICLNVTGHKINIQGTIFADYDEHSSKEVIQLTQKIASNALNSNQVSAMKETYELGIDPLFEIKMKNGSFKLAKNIQIGDELSQGRILGIVYEECTSIVKFGENDISSDNFIWSPTKSQWVRSGLLFPATLNPTKLIQFITDNTCAIELRNKKGECLFIRDYREVPLPEMEEPYQEQFHLSH